MFYGKSEHAAVEVSCQEVDTERAWEVVLPTDQTRSRRKARKGIPLRR